MLQHLKFTKLQRNTVQRINILSLDALDFQKSMDNLTILY